MRLSSKATLALALAALAALAAGCARPKPGFYKQRWMDFADCFDTSVGFAGPLPYVRLKLTDYFVVAAGENQTVFALGWHGRYTGPGSLVEKGQGIPFVRAQEWPGAPPMIETKGPFSTTRTYDPAVAPAWGTALAAKYDAGLWLAWGLNVRLGFNVVEFADFAAGWFGKDILKDDAVAVPDWPALLERPETPRHPNL